MGALYQDNGPLACLADSRLEDAAVFCPMWLMTVVFTYLSSASRKFALYPHRGKQKSQHGSQASNENLMAPGNQGRNKTCG